MTALTIDPGPKQSAWLVLGSRGMPRAFAIWPNHRLLLALRNGEFTAELTDLVIEKVEGYGMPVGWETFETVFWSGRFTEAAQPLTVTRIGRKAVKLHLCGSLRAKDPNIRQALIDRYGGSDAIGRKADPGPLYNISKDVWSALAVAVTAYDSMRGEQPGGSGPVLVPSEQVDAGPPAPPVLAAFR